MPSTTQTCLLCCTKLLHNTVRYESCSRIIKYNKNCISRRFFSSNNAETTAAANSNNSFAAASAAPRHNLINLGLLATTTTAESQEELVNSLLKNRVMEAPAVAKVMKKLDRKNFIPQEARNKASIVYSDAPQAIGQLATISAPYAHALTLQLLYNQLLKLKENHKNTQKAVKILDIGSGSGYLTACLALLVLEEFPAALTHHKIIGIDHSEVLIKQSTRNIAQSGLTSLQNPGFLQFLTASALYPLPTSITQHKFDIINIGAAIESPIPQQITQLLAPDGSILAPIILKSFGRMGEQYLTLFSQQETPGILSEVELFACNYAGMKSEAPAESVDDYNLFVERTVELEKQLEALEQQLKAWNLSYKQRHLDRKASLSEILADEVAGPVLRQYQELSRIIKQRKAATRQN
jgi:protein-L-isoaspartate(D-aspartate) O-methyltransferase